MGENEKLTADGARDAAVTDGADAATVPNGAETTPSVTDDSPAAVVSQAVQQMHTVTELTQLTSEQLANIDVAKVSMNTLKEAAEVSGLTIDVQGKAKAVILGRFAAHKSAQEGTAAEEKSTQTKIYPRVIAEFDAVLPEGDGRGDSMVNAIFAVAPEQQRAVFMTLFAATGGKGSDEAWDRVVGSTVPPPRSALAAYEKAAAETAGAAAEALTEVPQGLGRRLEDAHAGSMKPRRWDLAEKQYRFMTALLRPPPQESPAATDVHFELPWPDPDPKDPEDPEEGLFALLKDWSRQERSKGGTASTTPTPTPKVTTTTTTTSHWDQTAAREHAVLLEGLLVPTLVEVKPMPEDPVAAIIAMHHVGDVKEWMLKKSYAEALAAHILHAWVNGVDDLTEEQHNALRNVTTMQEWTANPVLCHSEETNSAFKRGIAMAHARDAQAADYLVAAARLTPGGAARAKDLEAALDKCKVASVPGARVLLATIADEAPAVTRADAIAARTFSATAFITWDDATTPAQAFAAADKALGRVVESLTRHGLAFELDRAAEVLRMVFDDARGKQTENYSKFAKKLDAACNTLLIKHPDYDEWYLEALTMAKKCPVTTSLASQEHFSDIPLITTFTPKALAGSGGGNHSNASPQTAKKPVRAALGTTTGMCGACGESGHSVRDCPADVFVAGITLPIRKQQKCWECNKYGHPRFDCPTTTTSPGHLNGGAPPAAGGSGR